MEEREKIGVRRQEAEQSGMAKTLEGAPLTAPLFPGELSA